MLSLFGVERAEEQLKKFNVEIQAMKTQRVKLVRQMREENEKFRTWRQQKEREVTRLRDQDRKRQGQIQKMEALHTKQQHVLRRKMEDAAAVNKRLKEALCLQGKSAVKPTLNANSAENEQRIKSESLFSDQTHFSYICIGLKLPIDLKCI